MQHTSPAIMLFSRDLRLQDNPALAAATARKQTVIPLFVLHDRLLTGPAAAPNRVAFLLESLQDLRASLRQAGGELFLRRGDPVAEVVRLARETHADSVFCADDVSGYAAQLRRRLAAACQTARLELATFPGVTVVPPGDLKPAGGGDHYRVFTPYFRAWEQAARRAPAGRPAVVRVPPGLTAGDLPQLAALTSAVSSGRPLRGGESAALRALGSWQGQPNRDYGSRRDELAADGTSRLSPYLHLGCLSPLEAARAAGPGEFTRQLAWRDFFHQVTAAFPAITSRDYRDAGHPWRLDQAAFDAWRQGLTGVPIVDAGMRQLLAEGWMHNRARMITASFLCLELGIDWRLGARHFMEWLADGDIACNYGNWQWVAGTGNNTRPGQFLNPLRRALRFDPDGRYVRRHVPELASLDGPMIHQPWAAGGPGTARRYPAPIVDVAAARQPWRTGLI